MRQTRRKHNKPGKITIPDGVSIYPHELIVAEILSRTGYDVTFIPVGITSTPDIKYRGLFWEIKSPIGSSSRTLENNIRAAARQSHNIIIDLHRIKLPEEKCTNVIKRRAKNLGKSYRLLIITKSREIVELF